MTFQESQITNDTEAVWDSYPPVDNLKAHAQQRRGIVNDGNMPIAKSEWSSGFVNNVDNVKMSCCHLSAGRSARRHEWKFGTHLLNTHFDGVLTNRNGHV